MKIKTCELMGPALDWAVEKCKRPNLHPEGTRHRTPAYSTDWAQGGPIIDNLKGFEFKYWLECNPASCCEAHIHNYEGNWIEFGRTPLIAAMRCYVASKFGDEIDIPEELLQ